MIKNYLKIAWRGLFRHKVFSFINIFGLAVGLWGCMTVATVVIDELSYDRHWKKADNLYRIISKDPRGEKLALGVSGLITALPENFPEVKSISDIRTGTLELDIKGASVEFETVYSDTRVLDMLSLEVLEGNPETLVHGQENIVVSERFRDTYFPNTSPVGQLIYSPFEKGEEPTPYLITGVIKNIPYNTHLRSDVISLKEASNDVLTNKGAMGFSSLYLVLAKKTDVAVFTEKVNKWYADYMDSEHPLTFQLQSIKDAYLRSDFLLDMIIHGDLQTSYILAGVALLLLAIACVNFISLSAARSVYRLKAIGTRKVLGAKNGMIASQFLVESLLYFVLATVLATLCYYATLPMLLDYWGHPLEMVLMSKPGLLLATLAVILSISLLVGWYPAVLLSGFRPVNALKGKLTFRWGGHGIMQKGLVVTQFVIALVVMIGLWVVGSQWTFLKNKDVGYHKENLLAISYTDWENKGKTFKQEVRSIAGVKQASLSKWIPTRSGGLNLVADPEDSSSSINIARLDADMDFVGVMGLQLEEGRLFDPTSPKDFSPERWVSADKEVEAAKPKPPVLITDYTQKRLQINTLDVPDKLTRTTPIGIIRHFNMESLKEPLSPTIIHAKDSLERSCMLIRTLPGQENTVSGQIRKLWKQFYPEKILELNTVTELLEQQYIKEAKLWQFFLFFGLLVLFLAALGVFGLVEQATAQRIKEIGIRKVLGAPLRSMVYLFSRSFAGLLLIAGLIGMPIAWYGAERWLENYAYQVGVHWQQLIGAAAVVVVVTLLTSTLQVLRATRVNPAESLRSE